jgi:peroxiredoxin Q/BCP
MNNATDFTLNDQYDNPFNLFEILESNKYVLLIFYPGDFTPVCTKQLTDYNSNRAAFKEFGIFPVGINIGSVDSHCSYAETYKLDFPLLSDNDKSVSRIYGALNLSGGNKRKLVLIDNKRTILFEDTIFPLFYQKVGKILEKVRIKNSHEF